MKIFVVGTRGIPDIPGGVERHCQELYPRIVARGHEVLLCTRKPYLLEPMREWRGVRLLPTYAPRVKSLEAIVHTLISLFKAAIYRPDLVHIHAIGPALLTPLARILGLKTVVTHHGPDYERKKWGRFAKMILRIGEWSGCRWANVVIAISSVIVAIVRERTGQPAELIHNGVTMPVFSSQVDHLQVLNIRPGRYVLAVARFVPEKGLDDLIRAFHALGRQDIQLVIAGDADHETEYSRRLRDMVARTPRVVLTGYLSGEALRQVYTHARLFVLPSYHEGLPISLLEAMSFGLTVLASDIPANVEVGLPERCYHARGDVADLERRLGILLDQPLSAAELSRLQSIVREKYDWETIAEQTIRVYEQAWCGNTT